MAAIGLGLALLCLIGNLAVGEISATFGAEPRWAAAVGATALLMTHSFFVLIVADLSGRRAAGEPAALRSRAVAAARGAPWLGIGLAVLGLATFLVLRPMASQLWKAPSPAQFPIDLGALGLLLVLWGVPTFFAAPVRVARFIAAGSFSLPRPSVRPAARLLALLPWALVIHWLGTPARTCSGECWGLFEGGVVMWPLLGLTTFTASLTCGVLSALFVQSTPECVAGRS